MGSYAALLFAPVGFVVRVVFALLLVIASVAAATNVMHDGNHGAFSTSARANRVAGWTSDVLGGSSFLWRFKHNKLHHLNANVAGYDTDIDQAPFAHLAPQQQWRPWHRYQHLYMWVLYGFLALQWFLLSDFAVLVRCKIGSHPLPAAPPDADVAMTFLGKAVHLGWAIVLPMICYPWWGVLGFYLASSWLVGFVLANVFQLAHCVDRAEFLDPDTPRRGADFEAYISCGPRSTSGAASPCCATSFTGSWVGSITRSSTISHAAAPHHLSAHRTEARSGIRGEEESPTVSTRLSPRPSDRTPVGSGRMGRPPSPGVGKAGRPLLNESTTTPTGRVVRLSTGESARPVSGAFVVGVMSVRGSAP